jgi:hypothetical protein
MWKGVWFECSAFCILNYYRSHFENLASQEFQGSIDGASVQDIEVWLVFQQNFLEVLNWASIFNHDQDCPACWLHILEKSTGFPFPYSASHLK